MSVVINAPSVGGGGGGRRTSFSTTGDYPWKALVLPHPLKFRNPLTDSLLTRPSVAWKHGNREGELGDTEVELGRVPVALCYCFMGQWALVN